MSSIKSLEQYISNHQDNVVLSTAAGVIMLMTTGNKHTDSIFVIDGYIDLSSLEKGYYLRFLDRKDGTFHLYGVEVFSKGNLVVHENIPQHQLKNHCDTEFKEQLLNLHKQRKIYFRTANSKGEGGLLHEDLAIHYSEKGSVGKYTNPKLFHGNYFSLEKLSLSEKSSSGCSKDTNAHEHSISHLPEKKFMGSDLIPKNSHEPNCSASNFLILGAGFFAVASAATLIIGALALTQVISIIPPLAVALVVGGGVTLGASLIGLGIFGLQRYPNESADKLDSMLKNPYK